MNTLQDVVGRPLKKGQSVVRVQQKEYGGGPSPYLEVKTITSIVDGKIYLDGSKVPIKYPGRLAIIAKVK